MNPEIQTFHVLESGEIISSLNEFLPVEEKFKWVDKKDMIKRVIALRSRTEPGSRSALVYYENGKMVKEFLNVLEGFKPLGYC